MRVKDEVCAILIGGPEGIPLDDRVQGLAVPSEFIRCRVDDSVEFFRFHGERMAFDPSVLVYEWSHRELDASAPSPRLTP